MQTIKIMANVKEITKLQNFKQKQNPKIPKQL